MLILKSRLKKSVTAISLFLLGVALSYTVNGAEKNICKVLVDYDFNKMKTPSPWIGWSQGPQTIKLVKSEGNTVLQYTGNGWNTPMVPINPSITVTDTTAMRFGVKTSRAGGWEINIRNQTENARYSLFFTVPKAEQWTDIVILLKDATYKSGGKAGNIDGILGDKISRVQLAFSGKKIEISNFKIFNINPKDISNLSTQFPMIKNYLATYKDISYPKLARNSVFPFGVIVTLKRGCCDNAVFFNQTLLYRYKMALQNIKSYGFNTVSNFCNSINTGDNLELMKKNHLFLLETATCGPNIHAMPDSTQLIRDIKKYSHVPNLLAWYGQDEPTDIEKYLKNKKRVETISAGGSPYVSAMHMNYIVKTVGPCMEVIIIDPYSLNDDFDPIKSSRIILSHSTNIKMARDSSRSKRVWMIPQAFGMRRAGRRTLRLPLPAEVRLEIFNSLASGVKGFIFFIYNESVPYLDKKVRGEEFDQTMVDAWYNGNPMTDELSKLAKRLIPVMPSFLDVEPGKDLKIRSNSKDVFVRQWKNQYGTLIYCYNTNLANNVKGQLYIKLPHNVKLYNAESLKPESARFKFNLAPGDGNILFAAKADQFAVIAKEISFRQADFEWERLDVKLNKLATAGFDTKALHDKLKSLKPVMGKAVPSLYGMAKDITDLRNSNVEYCQISSKLTGIQKTFGRINALLTSSKNIKKVDHNPKWYEVFDSIRQLGTEYFKYKSLLDQGNLSEIPVDALSQLATKVNGLDKVVASRIN